MIMDRLGWTVTMGMLWCAARPGGCLQKAGEMRGETQRVSDYAFYSAQLRFFARTTQRIDADVGAMMDLLASIADAIEQGPVQKGPSGSSSTQVSYTIAPGDHRRAARALAGVAGLLQTHILPEVVAAGNAVGEAQVRWTIDRSMEAMTQLLAHADGGAEDRAKTIHLPPPPAG